MDRGKAKSRQIIHLRCFILKLIVTTTIDIVNPT